MANSSKLVQREIYGNILESLVN